MIKRDLLTVAALLIAAPALAQALDPHPGHQMSGAATQAPPAAPMDHGSMQGMDHGGMKMPAAPTSNADPMAGMDHDAVNHAARGHGGMQMAPAPKGITRRNVGPAEAALQGFSDALEIGNRDLVIARLAPDVTIVEDGVEESFADYVGGHLAADIAFQKSVRTILLERDVVPEGASHVRIVSKLRMISNRSDKAVDIVTEETAHMAKMGTSWRIVRLEWRQAQ
jgi:hypothetical protein